MSEYTIWDLFADVEREALRKEAEAKIAAMPDWEKFFALGLLRHEEKTRGQAGIESVIAWIATRTHSEGGE